MKSVKVYARIFLLQDSDFRMQAEILTERVLMISNIILHSYGNNTFRMRRKSHRRKDFDWLRPTAIRKNQRMMFARALDCTSNDLPKSTF